MQLIAWTSTWVTIYTWWHHQVGCWQETHDRCCWPSCCHMTSGHISWRLPFIINNSELISFLGLERVFVKKLAVSFTYKLVMFFYVYCRKRFLVHRYLGDDNTTISKCDIYFRFVVVFLAPHMCHIRMTATATAWYDDDWTLHHRSLFTVPAVYNVCNIKTS